MLGLVYLILFNRICCVVGGSQIQIQARSYQFCLGENLIDSLAIGLWPPINDPFLWTGCLKVTNETTPHHIHHLILTHKLPYLATVQRSVSEVHQIKSAPEHVYEFVISMIKKVV